VGWTDVLVRGVSRKSQKRRIILSVAYHSSIVWASDPGYLWHVIRKDKARYKHKVNIKNYKFLLVYAKEMGFVRCNLYVLTTHLHLVAVVWILQLTPNGEMERDGSNLLAEVGPFRVALALHYSFVITAYVK
jgi:hypothetical protein